MASFLDLSGTHPTLQSTTYINLTNWVADDTILPVRLRMSPFAQGFSMATVEHALPGPHGVEGPNWIYSPQDTVERLAPVLLGVSPPDPASLQVHDGPILPRLFSVAGVWKFGFVIPWYYKMEVANFETISITPRRAD